jgi:K+-transporting ATPase ATPase C chain
MTTTTTATAGPRRPARPAAVRGIVILLGFGLSYSLAGAALGRVLFPASRDRQHDRTRRPGRRLRAGRPALRRCTLLPAASVRRQLRPDGGGRQQPGAQQSGAEQAHRRLALASLPRARASPRRRCPMELVTQSGGGLDPHLSPAACTACRSRGWRRRAASTSASSSRPWMPATSKRRSSACSGQPRVNVLRLNLALDALAR